MVEMESYLSNKFPFIQTQENSNCVCTLSDKGYIYKTPKHFMNPKKKKKKCELFSMHF